MENLFKYTAGAAASLAGLLAPVKGLILCALAFIAIDFVTGVWADRKRVRAKGGKWGFESAKAWRSVVKTAFVMGGIVLAWLIDAHILGFMNLNLARLFTGFVCGVEFWSYLENAAEISGHPIFIWLKRFMKSKLNDKMGAEI